MTGKKEYIPVVSAAGRKALLMQTDVEKHGKLYLPQGQSGQSLLARPRIGRF
jgi:hypothetical protein